MKIIKINALLFLCLTAFNFYGCSNKSEIASYEIAVFQTLNSIPGITEQEIAAVEILRRQVLERENKYYVFSVLPSTEAFYNEDGEIRGWSFLLCEWLSGLFGIPFKPRFVTWDEYLDVLASYEVDFTGHMTPTEERRKTYFMTTAIAQNMVKSFRLENSLPLEYIAQARPLRYAFISGTTTINKVIQHLEPGTYEVVLAGNTDEIYRMLQSGEADAFFNDDWTEASFDNYGDVITKDFFPLIYSPVSLTTQNPELEPIINIVQKALDAGALRYLTALYNQGYLEYLKQKLFLQLTEEEKTYIRNNRIIPFIAEYSNYPVSFYNVYENQWQGIAIDILQNIEILTGLSFNRINNAEESPFVMMQMLESGEAALGTELIRIPERENRFLWPKTMLFKDNYALISKLDFPNIKINEIMHLNVGLIGNTAYSASFKNWFADHTGMIEYDNFDAAIEALDRGEVDLIMASRHHLLMLTNYRELLDYKTNIIFDQSYEATFGFNKDEVILSSVIDKALRFIDKEGISDQWMRKTYDYRTKLAEAQRPWRIGAAYLAVFTFVLTIMLISLIIAIKKVNEVNKHKNVSIHSMESILNSIDSMIYVTDPATYEILFMNDIMKQHYGIKGACVGQLCYKILQKDKGKRCSFCPCFKLDETPGKTVIWEELNPVTNNIYRNVDRYINWPNGKLVHIQQSVDITELITAKDQAEQSNRSKSIFLSHMSHEIRTPMNAILGIAEIQLQEENLPQETSEAFNKIYESGDLLLNIINDILDFSKIESGKLEIVPVKYDIPSLINDTAQLNRLRYESKPVNFTLKVDENTPVDLIGDELRIKQILNNILSNSFKYTDEGTVNFSVSAEKEQDGNATLVFCVTDTGQGMSENQLTRLFDEYSRFNLGTNRTKVGAGLGMSITKRLVDLMNGSIDVKSEPGVGSVFTIRIPQILAGADVCGPELSEKLRNFDFQSTSIAKKSQFLREYMPYGHVLIVDDVESNLYVAKGMLMPYGLKIETATNGFDAIENVKNGIIYDIILMDHMMPKMDGMETVKILREMGYTHSIVALTANALVGRAEMFKQNGFDGFISKPVDSRELNHLLNEFIRDKKPPEVVEEARRNQYEKNLQISKTPVNLEVLTVFIRDAENTVNVLENFKNKLNELDNNELETYTIVVHGMKSVLAVIDKKDLSEMAYRLEKAGLERDFTVMSDETPAFITALQVLTAKLKLSIANNKAKISSNDKISEENLLYLREKLQELKKACETFDKNTAKEILDEIKQNALPDNINAVLDEIAMDILHSAFKKAAVKAFEAEESLEK
ncbi:MAG: transporter substrate-binding domain-containing protein [Treponema sp.]|nr:transporter substrate-binding domain-containing protein [Treponema sp.]